MDSEPDLSTPAGVVDFMIRITAEHPESPLFNRSRAFARKIGYGETFAPEVWDVTSRMLNNFLKAAPEVTVTPEQHRQLREFFWGSKGAAVASSLGSA